MNQENLRQDLGVFKSTIPTCALRKTTKTERSASTSEYKARALIHRIQKYRPSDGLALSPDRILWSSIYAQIGSQAEIQTPTHWNLIG